MSVPSSMNCGPFTSKVLVKKRYLLFYFLTIWICVASIQLEMWWYWQLLYFDNNILFLFFLPLLFFVMYITAVLVSLIFSKFLLILVNAIHEPREGAFLRDQSDKDYRYWCIRNTIKKWPIWLAHKFPFPFLDNICLKLFGVKTTYSNSLFEGWVDTEFMEFGKNIIIGQGSIVQSSTIIGNLLIIKKTIIEDNVRIGAHSIVMPGSIIRKNSVLAANSITIMGQEIDESWIYLGVPAKRFKKNRFFDNGLETIIESPIEDLEELRKKYEMLYTKRHDRQMSIIERYKNIKERREREKERLQEGSQFERVSSKS